MRYDRRWLAQIEEFKGLSPVVEDWIERLSDPARTILMDQLRLVTKGFEAAMILGHDISEHWSKIHDLASLALELLAEDHH